jgi:membrane-associated protease RseP (regulator of RpoE activity)
MLAALAACLLAPAAVTAQDARPRVRPRVRTRVEPGPFGVLSFSDSRGRIGVIVNTEADAAADKLGARIEAVTPNGPAGKAGIKVGDIITRFNGTALGGTRGEDSNDEVSGPGMKLIELARALEPGDTVQVEYRRGTDTRKAAIVAEDLGWASSPRVEMPEMGHLMEDMIPRMQGAPGEFQFSIGPWGGIELVKLNPDLGDYFGTREGVLVVRAPEDSTLGLKGGDVILSIGGRKPTSPEQAMRILRSYDTGETVTLDVQRKQKRVSVTWKVPENEGRYFHLRPDSREREEPSRFKVAPRVRELQGLLRTARVI